MITLAPLTDKKSVRAAWEQNWLTYSDISGCVEARCGDEALGYCLYTLDGEKMIIFKLITDDFLADGLLAVRCTWQRSARFLTHFMREPIQKGFVKSSALY